MAAQSVTNVNPGEAYTVRLTDEALVDDGELDILIITPATGAIHLTASATVGGESSVFLFEDTTVSGNGSALAENNRDRQSTSTTGVTTFSGPTITAVGTELWDGFIEGGGGGNASGGSARGGLGWVLARSSLYMVRLKNLSGGAIIAGLTLDFFDTNS